MEEPAALSNELQPVPRPAVAGGEPADWRVTEALVEIARRWPTYARLAWDLVRDPRVPAAARRWLAAAGAYSLSPIDPVPGIIPVLGQLATVCIDVVDLLPDGALGDPAALLAILGDPTHALGVIPVLDGEGNPVGVILATLPEALAGGDLGGLPLGTDVPVLDGLLPFDPADVPGLGGFVEDKDIGGGPLLIDSHGNEVAEAVWRLYCHAIGLAGAIPTLIEWDNAVPCYQTLAAEAARAAAILDGGDLIELKLAG